MSIFERLIVSDVCSAIYLSLISGIDEIEMFNKSRFSL